VLAVLAGSLGVAWADSSQQKFHRAYYLERAERDWAGAAEVYEELLDDRRTDDEIRARAEARLAGCREQMASSDLTRLVPPDVWAYVEVNRPGDQVIKLLDKLGLLADAGTVVGEGERRVAITPELVREVLGLGGAAVAVTGFDAARQMPSGVLVVHPGDLELVRGLIESGLPIGGTATERIGGFPTYQVEGKVLVTLTSRLVVVSNAAKHIQGVLDRLQGSEKESLATNAAFKDFARDRQDSLMLFFVNAKAMMPVLTGLLAVGAAADRELAMAQALVDLQSLQSLTGRFGVSGEGISLDLALRLDEGHRNLVYNLLRTPAVDQRTLECVPEGAAAFIVGALNEPVSRHSSGSSSRPDKAPPISILDLGREVFANITSFAVFATPPTEPQAHAGPPIPDVAAVLNVNDPGKSEALWGQFLGIASLANGAPSMKGTPVEVAGVSARSYKMPEGVTVYFTTVDDHVIIASSKAAVEAAAHAKRNDASVSDDRAFAASLSRISPSSTKAVVIHAGRCVEIARQFMPPGELAEAEPYMAVLSDTVASLVVDHSDEVFRISVALTGIPDVGDLVARMVTEEVRHGEERARLTHAVDAGKWDEALAAVDRQLAKNPDSLKLMQAKFKVLAVGRKDREAALALADAIYDKIRDDANALNSSAWALLTEGQFGDEYAELALKLAQRANELTDFTNWMYLDTLALARFETGDPQGAVAMERKAIEHCNECWGLADMKKALGRFESAIVAEAKPADDTGSR